jgi:hypothetical protein
MFLLSQERSSLIPGLFSSASSVPEPSFIFPTHPTHMPALSETQLKYHFAAGVGANPEQFNLDSNPISQ